MKHLTDEFAASWGVSAIGFVVWFLFLMYLATRQLEPLL
jgi:hypothetical protein